MLLKSSNMITRIYKDNSLNLVKISKIQKLFKWHLFSKFHLYKKPININIYITKKIIMKKNLFETNWSNDKLNLIFQNGKENEINEDIDSKKNDSIERNSTYINAEEENRNDIPIKIMHTKLHKNCINFHLNSRNNNPKRSNSNKNKYINIESLPSYNSLKTNSKNYERYSSDINNKINITISVYRL